MSQLGKPFLKKSHKKTFKTENQCQNAACEEKSTSKKRKFASHKKLGLEGAINGQTSMKKNPIQTVEKTVQVKVKLPHVNKKSQARTRTFVQTPFSLT